MGERIPNTFNLTGHYFWFFFYFHFVFHSKFVFFYENVGQNKCIELYKLDYERGTEFKVDKLSSF